MRLGSAALLLAACGHVGFEGPDAQRGADAVPDTAPPGPPRVAGDTVMSAANAATISYSFSVDNAVDRVLLVSVHIAVKLATAPPVLSVTYGGAPLTRITFEDVANGLTEPRTEIWVLVAPPAGTANVMIQLQGVAVSLHSGAVELSGIDQTMPVRATSQTNGQSATASAVVTTVPGDLVIDFVGQGTGIVMPATGQTPVWVHNVSTTTALDNSGASELSAPAGSQTMGWVFAASDYWQQIALALRPAT